MTTLKLATTNEAVAAGDFQAMKQQLDAMSLTCFCMRREQRGDRTGPRPTLAKLIGTLVFVSMVSMLVFIERSFELGSHWTGIWILGSLVAYFLVGNVVRRYSKKPWTFAEQLDGQLSSYQPVGCEAYRELQRKTEALGRIDEELVSAWLALEKAMVEEEAEKVGIQLRKKPPKPNFVGKEV